MEITLVLVTLLSLALAVGMGALLWRLLQDERQRTDARVAALVDGYAQRSAADPLPSSASSSSNASPSTVSASAMPASAAVASSASGAPTPGPTALDARAANSAHVAPLGAARTIRPDDTSTIRADDTSDRDWLLEFPSAAPDSTRPTLPRPAPAPSSPAPISDEAVSDEAVSDEEEIDLPLASDSARVLFGQVEQADRAEESSRQTMLVVGAALLVGLVLAIWTVTHLVITFAMPRAAAAAPITMGSGAMGNGAAGTDASGPAGAGVAVATTPAGAEIGAAAAGAPLELLTLQPTQDDGTVTIRGLVRNPPNGAKQERLTAVVFFFNQRGDLLASVRAPLDFRVLAPGDESPFQVSTPAPAGVSRFRVSFRRDTSGASSVSGPFDAAHAAAADIVPHVDRRQSAGS